MLSLLGLVMFLLLVFLWISAVYFPSIVSIVGWIIVADIVLMLILIMIDRYKRYKEEDKNDYSKY